MNYKELKPIGAIKKILLLNPPGKKLYIRDYYCSKVSKSNYLFHPVDLLMQSGRLSEKYEVHVIDAIADRINPKQCVERIESIVPDVIISLIGSVSYETDIFFLKQLKNKNRLLIVSGDVPLENTSRWLHEHPFVDAVLLDFTSEDILFYLENNNEAVSAIVYRKDNEICVPSFNRPVNQIFELPVPRHELFNSKNYNFPFVKDKQFATVLTDFGCPFKCTFCVMATLGYKYRTVENIIDELNYLKQLGKKEIFFMDQTFAINKNRLSELCGQMKNFGLGWVCYSRVDVVDDKILQLMKSAGCHTIIFGVESASESILKKYQKGYTRSEIKKIFGLCKKYNIRTVATFIIGLPEETLETANETISFLKEINCDFASFNIAVPRSNTPFRKEAIKNGMISENLNMMDQTGSFITLPTSCLTREEVLMLKKKAVKQFYLRPSYLLNRMKAITSFYELKEQISEGIALFHNLFQKRGI